MASFSGDRLQYLVLTALSLVVLGFTAILYSSDPLLFQRFLGRINPLIAFLIVIFLGFILLSYLQSRNWFALYTQNDLRGLLRAAGLASLFGVIIILADTRIVFPANMNIPFPQSLLFYPAIAFLAEILFHVLPLALLLVILKSMLKNVGFETMVWICILIVSFLEPIYHVTGMAASNQYATWSLIFVGLHIFLISLTQLLIFRKYDFISMYAFRLVYYLFWHIGWGYLRLRVLF
jgi:hypothetical protein